MRLSLRIHSHQLCDRMAAPFSHQYDAVRRTQRIVTPQTLYMSSKIDAKARDAFQCVFTNVKTRLESRARNRPFRSVIRALGRHCLMNSWPAC